MKELEQTFRTQEDCLEYYQSVRWITGTYCPHCSSEKYYTLSKRFQYKCANKKCLKQFNVLTKSFFENTKLPLTVWFTAIYIHTSHKKGISSVQLAKDIGVRQTTAWFMLHRIRGMLTEKVFEVLSNEVEADETYIGGKNKNKHPDKRTKGTQGRSTKSKTIVFGLLERNGLVRTKVIENANSVTINSIINHNIRSGSCIYTDEWRGYNRIRKDFYHERVHHNIGQYVDGNIYTNTIEGFWSHLKRGITGTYHQVNKKHLQKYCIEFAYRYNTRKWTELDRFEYTLFRNEGRLKYKELIAA